MSLDLRPMQIVFLRLEVDGHPAVAIGGDPFVRSEHKGAGMLLGPAVMHRRTGLKRKIDPRRYQHWRHRWRPRLAERHLVEAEEGTGIGELVLGPEPAHDVERFIEQRTALLVEPYWIEC